MSLTVLDFLVALQYVISLLSSGLRKAGPSSSISRLWHPEAPAPASSFLGFLGCQRDTYHTRVVKGWSALATRGGCELSIHT